MEAFVRVPIAVMLLAALLAAGPSTVQAASPCGPFRAEWHRGVLSPEDDKLEGFVYNESACAVSDVRIRVTAINEAGRPVAEAMGWVYGDIQAGARGYFVMPLPEAPAADYQIDVVSFDEIAPGQSASAPTRP